MNPKQQQRNRRRNKRNDESPLPRQPVEKEPQEETPTPRVTAQPQRTRVEPIHAATIDKPIPRASLPRVPTSKSTKGMTPKRIEMRERIRKHIESKTMARIPQQRTHLQQQIRTQERAQTIHDKETNTYLKYRQLLRHPNYTKAWNISAANEFGRLAQGLKDGRVKGTNTIRFIQKDEVPSDRMKDVTYGSFSCDFKPNKEEKERTRLTAGGDRINYPDDCGTPTADMMLFKILINSILSTPNAKCTMMDIKDFYLRTPMK